MKNFIALVILIFLTCELLSQVDPYWNTDGNSGTDPVDEFLGSDDNVGLAIRTNDHIRMLFREGTDGDEDGEIAIGASLAGNDDPLDRIHLMEDEQGRIYIRFTQGDLASTTTIDEDEEGLQIGLSANAAGGYADFKMRLNPAVRIWHDNIIRMYFEDIETFQTQYDYPTSEISDATRVGIFTDYTQSQWDGFGNPMEGILHLFGEDEPTYMERGWMHIGTAMSDNEDFMYVGLQQRHDDYYPSSTNSITDAVIAWGKDDSGTEGPDNLRFVFLNEFVSSTTDDAETYQGLEVGRFALMEILELETLMIMD